VRVAVPHVLLTGASGYLGRYLRAELRVRGLRCTTLGRRAADITCDFADDVVIQQAVAHVRPTHVLNAAAVATVAACERDPAHAMQVNAAAVAAFLGAGARLLQVSTDMVFDGGGAPYAADAEPRPLSVYGASKRRGEEVALRGPRGLVVRLPLLFGTSHDGKTGATDMIRYALRHGTPLTLFADEFRTPLHVADAARAVLDLLLDDRRTGVVHLPGPERVSRADLGLRFLHLHDLLSTSVEIGAATDALRPRDASLLGDWHPPRSLDAMLREA
jgi:dTDP-4-dehydrorhamnose reductase